MNVRVCGNFSGGHGSRGFGWFRNSLWQKNTSLCSGILRLLRQPFRYFAGSIDMSIILYFGRTNSKNEEINDSSYFSELDILFRAAAWRDHGPMDSFEFGVLRNMTDWYPRMWIGRSLS